VRRTPLRDGDARTVRVCEKRDRTSRQRSGATGADGARPPNGGAAACTVRRTATDTSQPMRLRNSRVRRDARRVKTFAFQACVVLAIIAIFLGATHLQGRRGSTGESGRPCPLHPPPPPTAKLMWQCPARYASDVAYARFRRNAPAQPPALPNRKHHRPAMPQGACCP
jgi:hypothetical protein